MHPTDRRRSQFVLQNILLPILVALIAGVPAGIVSSAVALSVLETKFAYLQSDVVAIKVLMNQVVENDKEIAEHRMWMNNVEKELIKLDRVERDVSRLQYYRPPTDKAQNEDRD